MGKSQRTITIPGLGKGRNSLNVLLNTIHQLKTVPSEAGILGHKTRIKILRVPLVARNEIRNSQNYYKQLNKT